MSVICRNFIILLCFILIVTEAFGAESFPKIRVRISKNIPKVVISGMDLNRKFLSNGQARHYPGRKQIKFDCKGIGDSKKYPSSKMRLVTVYSDTGLISVSGEKYRGSIIITTSDDKKGCDVINEVDIESYIGSLLSKEMNGEWHLEALKAQAVAARTYAIFKIRQRQLTEQKGKEQFYDIESSEKHQVGGSFFDATAKTLDATRSTVGQVLLTKSGSLTETFFHASCGGKTLIPNMVWSNSVEGYESVNCPYCEASDKHSYIKKITTKRFIEFLKWALEDEISVIKQDLSRFSLVPDRLKNSRIRVYLNGRAYLLKKSLLRKYFGRFTVPSNNFVISAEDDILVVVGKGHGHGVGMCQVGALHMAKGGSKYDDILNHYFPNHVLKKIYK